MAGILDWAKDLLVSRGALVEAEEAGALRAMLPDGVATTLGASDWLSLRFGAGAGSDDEGDWLERLGRLLPPESRTSAARLRFPKMLRSIDAAAVLDRELVLQNGIYRLPEESQSTARYYFLSFQYTIESDETSLGQWTTCLNATAHSVAPRAELLLNTLSEDLEDDPDGAIPREELAGMFGVALAMARPEVRLAAAAMEQNANRRLARDSDRINTYYGDLQRQIAKRIARHSGDPPAAEKERSRAAATELDRAAKLDDLARRYSLKIRIEPGDVLAVTLPVREIQVRVIRKKAERVARLHWNPVLGALEFPWCEACRAPAHPVFLCDERVHFLCKACQAPCARCGRVYCRACQARCRCGAQSGQPGEMP
ncbi:MAG TPA: hypothetical protein VME43_08620 [Bryobacteraceae bacterium]|nr:hypothetical protein [Bryobacteraceae bacterium]